MLESSVGAKKSGEIQSQIDELVKKRDPFIAMMLFYNLGLV